MSVVTIIAPGEYPERPVVTTLIRLHCTWCGGDFWPSQRHDCSAPWGSAQIIVTQLRIAEG